MAMEQQLKVEFTEKTQQTKKELEEVMRELEAERAKGGDYTEKLAKMAAHKKDAEQQLAVSFLLLTE